MISDKTRKALERVGMTSSEIKTFSALLAAGEQTASEVSQKSGVPLSKIYEVLGALEDKGWAGSDDSRPTRYVARPPAAGLDELKRGMDERFEQDRDAILGEMGPLYEKSGTSEKPDIWVLSGTMNIAAKIMEMVENCRKEVMIAVPEASQELVKQALPKLRLLHDKGIQTTVLTSDKMDRDALKAVSRVASVKVRKGLFGGGIISDSRYVVILLGSEIGGAKAAEAVAIWADHAGLAGFAREYFEYLLKDSERA